MARILHIEDDPKNRLLVRKLLGVAGHEVIEAEGGIEGIRLARESAPELVLVDVNIPDLDGYEVTLRLRGMKALEDVPIVAITAEGDREISLAVGADGFLEKPIDASRFAKQIARFLKGHKERGRTRASQQLRIQGSRTVERLERKVVELSEANARLEEMMHLRREFLRNLSHELATPMTPIVGYLRLLIGEELGELNPMQAKSLAAVQDSTERLRGLIDTLLDVSSLETGRMHFYDRAYDFGRVAARAIEHARPRLDARKLEVHVEPAPAGLSASGDPDKVRRAIVHVLDNAAKFSETGGTVAIGIERHGEGAELSYELRVADDGPGIPPDKIGKILEPFYQADGSVTREYGGVGLGLAFARRVHLHAASARDRRLRARRDGGRAAGLRAPAGQRPRPRRVIYLDHHAASPPDEAVRAAMEAAREVAWANPASAHAAGRAARSVLEAAREKIADAVGAKPADLVLTAGGTEACNLAVRGVPGRGPVLLTRVEHPATREPAVLRGEHDGGVSWLELPAGRPPDAAAFEAALAAAAGPRGDVALAVVQMVSHETGTVLPVAEYGEVCRRRGVPLVVDATQALGKIPLDVGALGATAVTFASSKIGGPPAAGALWIARDTALTPQLIGGAQERGRRAGSPDPVAMAGFGEAAARVETRLAAMPSVATRRDTLEAALLGLGAVVNGEGPRVATVSNVSVPGWKGTRLVAALDLEGLCASHGAACSSGVDAPSEVMAAMYPDAPWRAESALRLSLAPTTSDADIEAAIRIVSAVIPRKARA